VKKLLLAAGLIMGAMSQAHAEVKSETGDGSSIQQACANARENAQKYTSDYQEITGFSSCGNECSDGGPASSRYDRYRCNITYTVQDKPRSKQPGIPAVEFMLKGGR
jgi:hypothetical protein